MIGDGSEVAQAGENRLGVDEVWRQQVEQSSRGDGADVPVRGDRFAAAQFDAGDTGILGEEQPSGRLAEADADAVGAEPALQFVAVEFAEGNEGQFDLEAAAMAQEAVDKDLAGIAQADAVDFFIEGADEDKTPEPFDGPRCLTVAGEPVAKGFVGVGSGPLQTGEAPGDAEFVAQGQVMGGEEGAGQVKGSGQGIGGETADAPVGGDEIETGLGLQQVGDADGPAEMGEVGAAAHADMLAGVDELPAGGVGKGPGPPAGRWRASRMVTLQPRSARAAAVARPARPAPMTQTRSAIDVDPRLHGPWCYWTKRKVVPPDFLVGNQGTSTEIRPAWDRAVSGADDFHVAVDLAADETAHADAAAVRYFPGDESGRCSPRRYPLRPRDI